jgi:nitrogen fixation/metabolism regulation signal transduction histidine kinase
MPILLNLERSLDDGIINNLTNMIQNSLLVYGSLTMKEISSKLVFLVLMVSMCLYVFIIGVTTQI